MAKKVTLDDIARETGLSSYSVSRALAGKSGISAKTRERVLEASRRLGYVKSNSLPKEKHILLMIPQEDLNSPAFWMKVVQGVEDGAAKNGFQLIVKILRNEGENGVQSELSNAAGVIFAGYRSVEYARRYRDTKPALLMSYPPKMMFEMDCLYCADEEGSFFLCNKLLGWGHKKFIYIGDASRPSASKRYQGVRQALSNKEGVSLEQISEEIVFDLAQFRAIICGMRSRDGLPTAFLCESDHIAVAVSRTLLALRIPIPEDASIVCFNNDPRDLSVSAFTGMGLDKVGFGNEAIRVLMERITKPMQPYKRISVLHQFYDFETAGTSRK